MAERLDPILPQVPVEGIAIHIGRSGLCMGDAAQAQLLKDGRVGIFARVQHRFMGVLPTRRLSYLGHLGPVAAQVLAPALLEGIELRLRVVVLTPEHLATAGPPEIHISVWGDQRQLAPFLALDDIYLPDNPFEKSAASGHAAGSGASPSVANPNSGSPNSGSPSTAAAAGAFAPEPFALTAVAEEPEAASRAAGRIRIAHA